MSLQPRSGWFRPATDFHGGTRAPEAQVRVVFNVRKQPAEEVRDRIALIPNANASSVIGFGYFEPRHLAIQAKDVVFTRMEQTRHGAKTDANNECFSSFNGEVIPHHVTRQAQFNRLYLAVGVTQGGSDPDFKMGGDNSGITVITAGGTTITNHSEREITYGEFVRAVPPHINVVERESHQAAMEAQVHENFIVGKYQGRLEVVTYEDMISEIDEAVATLAGNITGFNLPERARDVQNNVPVDDSDVHGAALNLKRFLSWSFFSAFILLKDRPALQVLSPIQFAAKVGLHKDAAIAEDGTLQLDYLSRALISSLSSLSNTVYDKAYDHIVSSLGTPPAVPLSLFGTPSSTPSAPEQVRKEGAVAYDLHWRSQAHLLERNSGEILGQAISRTGPGGPLDINLRAS